MQPVVWQMTRQFYLKGHKNMYKIWSRDPFIGSFNITTVKPSYKRTIHRSGIVISLHDLLMNIKLTSIISAVLTAEKQDRNTLTRTVCLLQFSKYWKFQCYGIQYTSKCVENNKI